MNLSKGTAYVREHKPGHRQYYTPPPFRRPPVGKKEQDK